MSKFIFFFIGVCLSAAAAKSYASHSYGQAGAGSSASSYSGASAGAGGVGQVGSYGPGIPSWIPPVPTYGVSNRFFDPIYMKMYNEHMAIIAKLQQQAKAGYPYAGFGVPNSIIPYAAPSYAPRTVPVNHGTGTGSEVFTSGAVSYGAPGGVGIATSYPSADGLGLRVAEEEFPAPSGGGPIGTFSSSSAGVSSVNGKTTSFKTSTIGVNDNGRIHFRTISE